MNGSRGVRGSPLERSVLLGLSLCLFGYVAVRAARMALTFDEARTYFEYIAPGPLAGFNLDTVNNHFLNSLLANLFSLAGGTSALVLRLPNLLAFPVYLLFSYLILARFIKNSLLVMGGFVLLAANPYVLDFFSLCRGYGLSLAFLQGSLYFYLSFLEEAACDAPDALRRLRYSLVLTGLAVLANYTLLDVYFGLAAFALGFFIIRNLKTRRQPTHAGESPAGPGRIGWGGHPEDPRIDARDTFPDSPSSFAKRRPRVRRLAPPALFLVAFNLMVMVHDPWLASRLFAPVTVRVSGPDEPGRQGIEVFWLSADNRPTAFRRSQDHWELGDVAHVSAIRIQAPEKTWEDIRDIEVGIGPKVIILKKPALKRALRSRRSFSTVLLGGPAVSLHKSSFPGMRGAANWRGDAAFLKVVFLRLILVAGVFLLVVVAARGAAAVLERRRIIGRAEFCSLAGPTLAILAMIAYPLYNIRRSGGLYWGGKSGFIRDTVLSLISNSLYGRSYVRGQEWIVFSLAAVAVVLFVAVLFVARQRGRSVDELPGQVVLFLLGFAALASGLRHALLGTPYLVGRTALFGLPLFALLVAFLAKGLRSLGPGPRRAAAALVSVLAALLALHLIGSANLVAPAEWRQDADTAIMLDDLASVKNREFPPGSRLSLGFEWRHSYTLKYYKMRKSLDWLVTRQTPPYDDLDFYFAPVDLALSGVWSRLTILKSYPCSGTILARFTRGPSAPAEGSRSDISPRLCPKAAISSLAIAPGWTPQPASGGQGRAGSVDNDR